MPRWKCEGFSIVSRENGDVRNSINLHRVEKNYREHLVDVFKQTAADNDTETHSVTQKNILQTSFGASRLFNLISCMSNLWGKNPSPLIKRQVSQENFCKQPNSVRSGLHQRSVACAGGEKCCLSLKKFKNSAMESILLSECIQPYLHCLHSEFTLSLS